jgi:antitoxin (DNA-binding transcriptional repressor) of toxin-antitoxin stability system
MKARIMRALDKGKSFIVTRNGVPVGELTALRRRMFVSADAAILHRVPERRRREDSWTPQGLDRVRLKVFEASDQLSRESHLVCCAPGGASPRRRSKISRESGQKGRSASIRSSCSGATHACQATSLS